MLKPTECGGAINFYVLRSERDLITIYLRRKQLMTQQMHLDLHMHVDLHMQSHNFRSASQHLNVTPQSAAAALVCTHGAVALDREH